MANYHGDRPTADSPVGSRNEASVDSELATLGTFSRVISGAMANPYYRSFTPIGDVRRPELMRAAKTERIPGDHGHEG